MIADPSSGDISNITPDFLPGAATVASRRADAVGGGERRRRRRGNGMYRKGEVSYRPIPLPDRVRRPDAEALAAAEAFRDHMRRRHSVRQFSAEPVPEAVIRTCIEAAATAPSGANHEPWHFVAIADAAMKARIRAAAEA